MQNILKEDAVRWNNWVPALAGGKDMYSNDGKPILEVSNSNIKRRPTEYSPELADFNCNF